MAAPALPNWKQMLAQEIGVPLTPGVSQFFDYWARAEGGAAENNPFNTTQPGYSAIGNYNSVGVKRYGTPQGGIQATAATLKNGRYGNIIQAMHTGDVRQMAQALANSPWGTGSLVLKMVGGGKLSPVASPPPTPPGQGLPQIPGMPQLPQVPNRLPGLLQAAAPSATTESILARLGGTAGRVAQAAQAPIPLPQPVQPLSPKQLPSPKGLPDQPPTQPQLPMNGKFKLGDPVVGGTSIGGEHPTLGLDGFPAHDYFAKPGTVTVAPVGGKIVKLSGHDPNAPLTEGPHGPMGWSVYIQGNDGHTYFITHMGSRTVKIGQRVKAGQPIGTVANYDRYGTPSHIHMGVH